MRLIRQLKILMGAILLSLLFGLALYSTIVSVALGADGNVGFGYQWIASFQDGDVNVYRLTEQRFDNCLVIVGELHGKTVAGVCN